MAVNLFLSCFLNTIRSTHYSVAAAFCFCWIITGSSLVTKAESEDAGHHGHAEKSSKFWADHYVDGNSLGTLL